MFGGEKLAIMLGVLCWISKTGMKKMDPGNEHKCGSRNFSCHRE
jgi:hypothetical protein